MYSFRVQSHAHFTVLNHNSTMVKNGKSENIYCSVTIELFIPRQSYLIQLIFDER